MKYEKDTVVRHGEICDVLNALYERKNRDYGDSFHKSYIDWENAIKRRFATPGGGLMMASVRLGDKYKRFTELALSGAENYQVKDESIVDTLADLANYAIMTIMELQDKELETGEE